MPADAASAVRSSDGVETNPCAFVRTQETKMPKTRTAPTASAAARADEAETTEATEGGDQPEATGTEAPAEAAAPVAAAPATEGDGRAAAELVKREEASRAAEIVRMCQAMKLGDPEALIRSGESLDQVRKRLIDMRADQAKESPVEQINGQHRVAVGDDLTRKGASEGVRNALMNRANPRNTLEDAGRRYRGLSLVEMARKYLVAHGLREAEEFNKRDVAGAVLGLRAGFHTTSDFPLILADVAGKSLRDAYAEAPQTFLPFSRRVTLPDFKQAKRTQMGEAPQLLKVNEHGEYTRGTIGEGREVFQLSTYGRVFAITRQVIINDDMDAFSRVPMLFGRSARDLESDLVWEQITSNPAMGDTVDLFHATHGNLGTGLVSVEAIGAGRAAMRVQTGVDGVQRINVAAKYLLVPAALETLADQFISTAMLANDSAKVNPFAGRLQVIAEPRLDVASESEWYLAADPGQIDTVEFAYLDGEEGPRMESRVGFDVDGLELKCSHDFAAKVIDWRGLYKSDGEES